jgi:hypothetical protein
MQRLGLKRDMELAKQPKSDQEHLSQLTTGQDIELSRTS